MFKLIQQARFFPDTQVLATNWGIARDSNLWEDPEVFRPERFLNAEGEIESAVTINAIPFGTGELVSEKVTNTSF